MAIERKVWGEPVEECRLSVSGPDPKVLAGHAVEVILIFRNDGEKDIGFPMTSSWRDYQYTLLYDGQPAPLTRFGERVLLSPAVAAAVIAPITPRQELRSAILINRLYDMSLPGRYVFQSSKELWNRAGTGFVNIVSNRITIDVVEE